MTSLPAWASSRNFHAQIAFADPSASVAGIACGDALCRIEVRQHGEDHRGDLAERMSGTIDMADASMAFAYSQSDPSRMFVYIQPRLTPEAEATSTH